MLVERPGGGLRDPERLDAVPAGARARHLAPRDAEERGELGPIGILEPDEEALPGRPRRGRDARLERADRRPRAEPDGHAVARAEDLRPDVVAERVVARHVEDRERPVPHPQGGDCGVHVAVLPEHLEAAHRAVGVDLLDLARRKPPDDVEVVDGEVAEEPARDRDVRLVGRRGVVAGEADQVDGAELARLDQPPRGPVGGVEAALEPDLEGDPGPLGVGGDGLALGEVEGERLLAEDREPAGRPGPDEPGVGVRRRCDDERLGPGDRGLDRVDRRCAVRRGQAAGPLPIDVGDQELDAAELGEEPGVQLPDPAGAEERDPYRRSPATSSRARRSRSACTARAGTPASPRASHPAGSSPRAGSAPRRRRRSPGRAPTSRHASSGRPRAR